MSGLFRWALAALLLILDCVACREDVAPSPTVGRLAMRLSTELNGVTYRLREAHFDISGPESTTLDSEDAPDANLIQVPLHTGDYTVFLRDGWHMERRTVPNGPFATVEANLIGPNPLAFAIADGETSAVAYDFEVAGAQVPLGEGDLSLSIHVREASNPEVPCTPDCVPLWSDRFGFAADSRTFAAAVGTDPSGGVLVAGMSTAPLPDRPPLTDSFFEEHAFVRKYDSTGAELWSRRFGLGAFAYSVASDAADDVLVAGKYFPEPELAGEVGFVRKYDPSGVELWSQEFGLDAEAASVAADSVGNVVVAGLTAGGPELNDPSSFDVQGIVRKYDAAGVELWTRVFGTGPTPSQVTSLAVGASDEILIVARLGSDGYALRKYTPDGVELWTRSLDTRGGEFPFAGPIAVNWEGESIVGGESQGATGTIAFLEKFDADGGELWTWHSDGAQREFIDTLSLSSSGRLFTAGRVSGAEALLREHDSTGAVLSAKKFGTVDRDTINQIAFTRKDSLVAAGTTGSDAFVVEFVP